VLLPIRSPDKFLLLTKPSSLPQKEASLNYEDRVTSLHKWLLAEKSHWMKQLHGIESEALEPDFLSSSNGWK